MTVFASRLSPASPDHAENRRQMLALVDRLWRTTPIALVLFGVLLVIAVFARPWLLRHAKTRVPSED